MVAVLCFDVSTVAFGADIKAPHVPPPPIPVFTWAGFYVGAQVGYEFGHSSGTNFNLVQVFGGAPGALRINSGGNKSGVIGGAHVGYLFSTQSLPVVGSIFGQNGAFGLGTGGVFGIEGDVDGATTRADYSFGTLQNTAQEDVQGSIRGRFGIAVDRVLFYATSGLALGRLHNTYVIPNVGVDAYDRFRLGYTVGGGIEYAFTDNLSARVEYRFTDFGAFANPQTNNTGNPYAYDFETRQRERESRVQVGVSYKHLRLAPAP